MPSRRPLPVSPRSRRLCVASVAIGLLCTLALTACGHPRDLNMAAAHTPPSSASPSSSSAAAPTPSSQESTTSVVSPALNIVTTQAGQLRSSTQPAASAAAVDFVDAEYGWAIGDCSTVQGGTGCSILATRDGGATWTPQYTGLSPYSDPIVLQFVDRSDGFVVDTRASCTRACTTDLLATNDGGKTWQVRLQIPATATPPFTALDFVTATTGWAVQPTGLAETQDGGRHWSPIFSTTACTFQTVRFRTPDDGWASGGGPKGPCLYQTVDGGHTWQQAFASAVTPSPIAGAFSAYAQKVGMAHVLQDPSKLGQGCGVSQVEFTSAADAWLVVECNPFDPGALAVLRTTDGGRDWSYVWGTFGCLMGCAGDGGSLSPLFFLDGATAWRAVPFGVARTTDGGQTWTAGQGLCAFAQCVPQLSFVDAENGWAATEQGIFVTRDGGLSWQRQVPAGGPGPLRAVDFVSPATGYAVPELDPNSILITHNAGRAWAPAGRVSGLSSQNGGPSEGVHGLYFLPTGRGWVWGVRTVLTTADGGQTWQQLPPLPASGVIGPLPTQVQQLDFVNAEDGWLLGVFGDLWRTEDGGKTWTRLPQPSAGSIHEIEFSDNAHGYAGVFAKGAGFALVSTVNGGATWTPVAVWPWPPQKGQFNTTSFSSTSPADGWLFAYDGLLRTQDGGRTWTEFTQPGLVGLFPQTIQFVSRNDGWILSNDGHLFDTTDGGHTWTEVDIGAGGQ